MDLWIIFINISVCVNSVVWDRAALVFRSFGGSSRQQCAGDRHVGWHGPGRWKEEEAEGFPWLPDHHAGKHVLKNIPFFSVQFNYFSFSNSDPSKYFSNMKTSSAYLHTVFWREYLCIFQIPSVNWLLYRAKCINFCPDLCFRQTSRKVCFSCVFHIFHVGTFAICAVLELSDLACFTYPLSHTVCSWTIFQAKFQISPTFFSSYGPGFASW